MKAMYKFELAVYAGITSKTFRRWLQSSLSARSWLSIYKGKERKGHFGKLPDAP